MQHSVCVLGEKIYCFGGRGSTYNYLNCIEVLNAKKFLRKQNCFNSIWFLIRPQMSPALSSPDLHQLLTARVGAILAPISTNQILILGGQQKDFPPLTTQSPEKNSTHEVNAFILETVHENLRPIVLDLSASNGDVVKNGSLSWDGQSTHTLALYRDSFSASRSISTMALDPDKSLKLVTCRIDFGDLSSSTKGDLSICKDFGKSY